jgi:CelD/BcsL family acetyltransferase involved in cellulose biosynthesis
MVSARAVAELKSVGELEELRDEWQALEGRLEESPYLRFEWLRAWARVYEPQRLAVVRVREGPDTVAAGLLEVGPRGELRFAGRPATPDCRLLCSSGNEASAWAAFVKLLRRLPWEMFEARGLSRKAVSALPEGWAFPLAWLGLRLAPSFDEYLSERSAGSRRALKGKLRRAAREGIEARPVPDGDRSDALHDFIRLHQLRATSKGQQHPAVDDRLRRMLADLGGDLRPRLFELIAGRRRIGVTVRVDTDHAAYFYNAGIDPHWGHVSPGILLQLVSIRDAIEVGLPRYDLGPGDFRYKRDLGGVLQERHQVAIERRGLRIRLGRSGTALVGRLRHSLRRVERDEPWRFSPGVRAAS